MRSRLLLLASLLVIAAAAVVVATAIAGRGDSVAEGPIPRVCWFSDYDNAKLSNRCDWNDSEARWYMEVDGRRVPADAQPLPEANLCHYFHGVTCPERGGSG
jgi:hypothetical protein